MLGRMTDVDWPVRLLSAPTTPRIEFAFFCAKAERDDRKFINVTRVLHTVMGFAGRDITFDVALVFGVEGPPNTTHQLLLRMVRPKGEFKSSRPLDLQIGRSGLVDNTVVMDGLPIRDPGDYRMEFRFNGESEPSHVATLRVLPPPSDVSGQAH
jgi:hypothetical protein